MNIMSEKIINFPPETPEQRLIWEVVFLTVIIVATAFFGQLAALDVIYTIILTIIFSVNIVIRFLTINQKGDWIFFVFGVIAGGGNDLMSMMREVYNYTSVTIIPFLDGLLPLWSIVFWGQVFLIFRKMFNLEWFKGENFQKNGRFLKGWIDYELIVDIILIVILRIIIYSTYNLEMWIPALLYAIFISGRLLIFRPKKNQLLIIAVLPYAFIFEGLMVIFGLYVYVNPIILGMPLWLLLWWIFLVPIVLKEIFDRIEYVLKKRS